MSNSAQITLPPGSPPSSGFGSCGCPVNGQCFVEILARPRSALLQLSQKARFPIFAKDGGNLKPGTDREFPDKLFGNRNSAASSGGCPMAAILLERYLKPLGNRFVLASPEFVEPAIDVSQIRNGRRSLLLRQSSKVQFAGSETLCVVHRQCASLRAPEVDAAATWQGTWRSGMTLAARGADSTLEN